MEQDTTHVTIPVLRKSTAELAWALMMDDDDLAEWFINAACYWAAERYFHKLGENAYCADRYARIMEKLGEVGGPLHREHENVADRFHDYLEPPF